MTVDVVPSRRLSRRFIFFGSSAVHLVWAICLYSSPAALGITPLWFASQAIHDSTVLASVFVLIAGLGLAGAWSREENWRTATLLFPQQVALWSAAASAGAAILNGHYADGVVRPTAFLLADQVNVIMLACLHTAAYLYIHATRWVWNRLPTRF